MHMAALQQHYNEFVSQYLGILSITYGVYRLTLFPGRGFVVGSVRAVRAV